MVRGEGETSQKGRLLGMKEDSVVASVRERRVGQVGGRQDEEERERVADAFRAREDKVDAG